MIVRLDHVGVAAYAWEEAHDALVGQPRNPVELSRTRMLEGNLYEPQNTRIYFVKVGLGETLVEILIPQDTESSIANYLAKRSPSLYHLGYACDDVPEEARRLRDQGLDQIPIDDRLSGVFFYPRSTIGILMELVTGRGSGGEAR